MASNAPVWHIQSVSSRADAARGVGAGSAHCAPGSPAASHRVPSYWRVPADRDRTWRSAHDAIGVAASRVRATELFDHIGGVQQPGHVGGIPAVSAARCGNSSGVEFGDDASVADSCAMHVHNECEDLIRADARSSASPAPGHRRPRRALRAAGRGWSAERVRKMAFISEINAPSVASKIRMARALRRLFPKTATTAASETTRANSVIGMRTVAVMMIGAKPQVVWAWLRWVSNVHSRVGSERDAVSVCGRAPEVDSSRLFTSRVRSTGHSRGGGDGLPWAAITGSGGGPGWGAGRPGAGRGGGVGGQAGGEGGCRGVLPDSDSGVSPEV